MIYNKNVEQLITERYAFVPLEFDLTFADASRRGRDPPSFATLHNL
jgi:hypothetical protein